MAESTGMSAADVIALTRNDEGAFGDSFAWIVMLLIIAGIFGSGFGFGGNSAGVTEEYIANQFTQRDLYNNNTNILTSASETQKEVLENRYANALNTQNIISSQKDCCCENKILGLQNTSQLAQLADRNNFNTLLGNKDLTSAITADGDKTRALITAQYEAGLLEQINDLKAQVNNAEQTQNILNTMRKMARIFALWNKLWMFLLKQFNIMAFVKV